MEETATLLIRVQSDQAETAKKRLNELGFAAKTAETATGGLTAAWKGLSAILAGGAGLATALAGLNKLKDVAKQFESLEAQLKTATGSAENAKAAFVAIQDFAKQTPYDLAQSTDAFIKLVNLGLEPSERALRSYGDTASAMGRQLSEMVNAVSRATTGEFEPLKSFGIKARQEAEGLAFTFRGVTETVGNSAGEIEQYFIRLGEKNFAGAMSERMATLEGKLSNLGDAWDFLFATIAKSGVSDLMKKAIDGAIAGIEELTLMVSSGELTSYLEAALIKIESIASTVEFTFQNLAVEMRKAFDMLPEVVQEDVSLSTGYLMTALKQFPENIRVLVGGIGATFKATVEFASQAALGVYTEFEQMFKYLIATAVNVGKEIWSHLNPGAEAFDYQAAQMQAFEEYANRTKFAWEAVAEQQNQTAIVWGKTIETLMIERDVSLKAFDEKIAKAKELRSEAEKNLAVEKALKEFFGGMTGDRLQGFGVKDKGTSAEFRRLVDNLRTQEQALDDSYARRRALIEGNTEKESELQISLLHQLGERFEDERRKMLTQNIGLEVGFNADEFEDNLNLEKAALDRAYEDKQERLKASLEAGLISEQEYNQRKLDEQKRYNRESEDLDREKFNHRLQLASNFFGNLASVANLFGAKGARAAKALAIVQTTIDTYKSATSAYSSLAGIPYVGPVLGAAAAAAAIAAGMANVAAIKSQNYAGAYAGGGFIPAGMWGHAREGGEAEIIHGPAAVTSKRATADLEGNNGGKPKVVVNITAGPGVTVEQTGERDDGGTKIMQFVAKQVIKEVAGDIRTRTGPISAELNRLGVRRGAA